MIDTIKPSESPPLAGVFQAVKERIERDPFNVDNQTLIDLVLSLVDSREFDLSRIERVGPAQAELCLALWDECIYQGLSEDERQAILDAFEAFEIPPTGNAVH